MREVPAGRADQVLIHIRPADTPAAHYVLIDDRIPILTAVARRGA